MIQVTYSFNTEAEAAAFFARNTPVVAAPVAEPAPKPNHGKMDPAVIESAKKGTAATGKPAAAPAPAPAGTPTSAPAAAAPETSSPTPPASGTTPAADAPSVERATVSAAIVKLATRDKARALAILGEFGAKAGKELKDDQLAACYAKVQAALEG